MSNKRTVEVEKLEWKRNPDRLFATWDAVGKANKYRIQMNFEFKFGFYVNQVHIGDLIKLKYAQRYAELIEKG